MSNFWCFTLNEKLLRNLFSQSMYVLNEWDEDETKMKILTFFQKLNDFNPKFELLW